MAGLDPTYLNLADGERQSLIGLEQTRALPGQRSGNDSPFMRIELSFPRLLR